MGLKKDHELILPLSEASVKAAALAMGSLESSYLLQAVDSIKDFQDPDLPPLLVLLQYICQLEGPLWCQIRGQGLAYGSYIYNRTNEGLLYFTLNRSTHVVSAWKEAKRIVDGFLSGDSQYEESVLESAKSSLIFELIDKEKSVGDIVIQSMLAYLKEIPHSYKRTLLRKVAEVTIADLHKVGPKYLVSLFDVDKCRCAVVCHPSKLAEIASGFKQLGLNITAYPTAEDSILTQA